MTLASRRTLGLLAYRELDAALGLTDLAGAVLAECRRGEGTSSSVIARPTGTASTRSNSRAP
jgi:hypothetical protein